MPIVILKRNKKNNTNDVDNKQQDYSVDMQQMIKKMFFLCKTLLDNCEMVVSNIQFCKLYQQTEDEEQFNQEYNKLKHFIEISTLLFGKKYSILDAISKITSLMQKIKIIADKLNIDLTNKNNNEAMETDLTTILTNTDAETIATLVRDLGIQAVCDRYVKKATQFEATANYYNNEKNENENNDVENIDNDLQYDAEQEEEIFKTGIQNCLDQHKNDEIIIYDASWNKK